MTNVYIYHLLAKFGKSPMKPAVKQDKPDQYLNPQKAHSAVSEIVPKIQTVLQRCNNGTARPLKITKPKNVTFKRTNMVYRTMENDFTTWQYYHQSSHPHFNLPPPHYSRVKLVSDTAYNHNPPNLAKLFHNAPRYDLFFQKVDNKVSMSSEYLYVSIIYVYGIKLRRTKTINHHSVYI